MSDFRAKMHKIRLPLGLCSRPRWGVPSGAYCAPNPLTVFKGPAFKGEVKGDRREMRGEENGNGREGQRMGKKG